MEFEIHAQGLEDARAKVQGIAKTQVPFATMLTMNRVMSYTREVLKGTMDQQLDRPTPYALRSMWIQAANKSRPFAKIHWRQWGGMTADQFLGPQIEGGVQRRMKSSEKKFGAYLIPSMFMPVDRFGNVRGSEYVRLLSNLGMMSDAASNASNSKRSKAKRARAEYVKLPGNNDTIFQRKGKQLLPMWHLQRNAPRYSRRWHFYAIGTDVINRSIVPMFDKAMADAMASMK